MISPKDFASIRVRFAEQPHGTRHRYLGGCRCLRCRAANSRHSSERAAAQRAGDWRGFVPATLVLDHIKTLSKGGVGTKAIAAAAGLARSTMQKIVGGKQQKIRKHHADRVLAVDRAAIADGTLVPAAQTWNLLNELLESGYTKTFLAKQLGSGAKTPKLQIQADRITALNASKVERRLYRRIKEGRVSPVKEAKIYQRKRYTANTPAARAVSELIDQFGGRTVLEAAADYCFQHLGLRCFLSGIFSIIIRDCATCGHRHVSCSSPNPRRFAVSTQSPAAAHLIRLRQTLERLGDWIADYISIPRSVVPDYLNWFFERLKGRVPEDASEQDLDQLVRTEVKSIYGEFRDRPSGFPLGDYTDRSAQKFAFGDQSREWLEQLPKPVRDLLEDVYMSDDEEITRDEMAKKLGIKRNTLDQRICRAMKTIRHRLKRSPAP